MEWQKWPNLIKSHNLNDLANEFKVLYYRFHKQVSAKKDDKAEFNGYLKALQKLIEILERTSETFRYSKKIDTDGSYIKDSIPTIKKIDLLELKRLYDEVNPLFVGAVNSMGIYTDYIDFIKENPEFTKGLGYLYCLKLHYSKEFLDKIKTHYLKKQGLMEIKDNVWMSKETGENFEIKVWQGNIYIIAINPSMI